MRIQNILIVFLISVFFSGCYKENINSISDSVIINSGFSLPIGNIDYDINEQLDLLNIAIVSDPVSDSIEYNDVVYPLHQSVFYVTELLEFNSNILGIDHHKIKTLSLHLIIKNSYPTETRLKVFFTDENILPVEGQDNIDEIVVIPAILNNEGLVIDPQTMVVDIPFSEELIHNIDLIRYLGVFGVVDSQNPEREISRFYSACVLNIHIGVRIGLEYDTSML